ncbi:MAG: GatB/YqeY domain-containing protein [Caldilineales bacterium]|nr:GatB/YqeY domain-containing protein [Caldilineales bacterium]
MTLLDTLNQDLKTAMKSGDDAGKRALRGVKSSISVAQKNQDDQPLTDDQIIAVLRKEAKQRQDSIEAFRQGGRMDLVAGEQEELAVIERYLPTQMDKETIRQHAQAVISEVGASSPRDMGRVMGVLMPRLKGQADGRLVNEVVRQLLAE